MHASIGYNPSLSKLAGPSLSLIESSPMQRLPRIGGLVSRGISFDIWPAAY
jgi:hypothetical protein